MAADYNRLAELINKHSEFQAILGSLRPGRLKEDKLAMLNALRPRIERYLGNDTAAQEAWAGFMKTVGEGYIVPLTPTARQTLAATLLRGAAIRKPGLQLRSDLSPESYQARADFLRTEVRVSPLRGSGTPMVFKPRPIAHGRAVQDRDTLAVDYDILTKRMRAGGKLDNAIQKLLTDPSRSLAPLGSMQTLDVATIGDSRKSAILRDGKRVINSTRVGTKSTKAYAPKRISLALNKFRCVHQQEDGGDEVFWGGSFVRCTNLAQVYAEIEKIMQQPRLPFPITREFPLHFEWGYSSFVRPKERKKLFKTKTGSGWIPFGPESIIFEQELFNGFGPWAGVVYLIEDDDAEYDAVAEVVDTVGDYAKDVGLVASEASVALAAFGVTGPAAVAAAAVTDAAAKVSLGAELAGAVIDIVNFFDNDDMIDSVNFSGSGDYAVRNKQEIQNRAVPVLHDLQESARGAHYQLELTTTYSDVAEFDRTWGCSVVTNWFPEDGGWYNKSGSFAGHKGEIEKTVAYNPPVQILEAHDLEKGGEAGPGHAEVIEGPILENNGTLGRVKVHWGINAFHSFSFKFYLQALRFGEKL